ncbi:helix-turn-helix transcriptional regulator [Streptomyces sp. NPDC091292]|uniref:helix-turn-helix transcriptional regulator n=1 Tax=Streptomyces sp. NPDC091292 TaxID=3365991 RepID=UPI00380FE96A
MASTPSSPRLRELGTFLRAHRERVAPDDVGLPDTPRRRTPGLRREEVAALSGVGVAWYTWLEQGRVETSRQVLDAVSRALRLDGDQRRHVLTLAGFVPLPDPAPAPPQTPEPAAPQAPAGLHRMIDAWPESPALVLDPLLTVTAWNTAYTSRWPDPGRVPPDDRNLLLLLTGDPAYQLRLPAWESVALDLHRHLRGHADTVPDDPRVRALAARLRDTRPDLAHWWACRSVGGFAPREVEVHGHHSGTARYELALLDLPGAHSVLVHTPVHTPPVTRKSRGTGSEGCGIRRLDT